MEALAAISLAGNVLQFVHLGVLVLKHVKEYRDGTTSQNYVQLRDELVDVKKLTTRLQDESLYQNTSQANRGLWTQARKCQEIADKMLREIEKLGIKDGDEAHPSSFRKASWALIRSPFTDKTMKRLCGELNSVEAQMQLYVTASQKDDLRQILQNQSQIFFSLDAVEKAIMKKLVDDDKQPLSVDHDIIIEQLERLHHETMQTFAERLGNIQLQLEEINGTLKQLSMQSSSHPATEVSGRALWNAIADGNESLVNSLLERGADTTFTSADARNESLLHLAARRGNARVLESLLRHGPELNAYSDEGITPLMSAALANKLKTTEILIDAGSDIDAPLKDTRDSVSGRVDIDNRTTKGSTALFLAAQHGHVQLAEVLISNGADVNVRTNHMFTPLHAATIGGFSDVAKLLIDHGAEIEARTDGRFTPLIYAAHHGKDQVALVLLEKGANIEAKKSLNMTPLLEAFWTQRVNTIKFLVNHGASIDVEVPEFIRQASLLHWAIDINKPEVVRLLLERKPDLLFWCRKSSVEDLVQLANRNGNPEIVSLVRAHLV